MQDLQMSLDRAEAVKALGKVAVLMGGDSAEREVSLKSGRAVLQALDRLGAHVVAIDTQTRAVEQLQIEQPDLVFLALHGPGGEDGTIQGVLETLGIPYTGSGVIGSALGMDKLRSKQIWHSLGYPTPAFQLLQADSDWSAVLDALGGQVMVKPAHEGSSIGMTRADSAESLVAAYQNATRYDAVVLAERWITGREYTVAILADQALPVIGLETDHGFYDYDAKYVSNDTRYLLPSGLAESMERQLQQLALAAFKAIGCHGWGRVDIMVDGADQPWLLEVNTLPGLTDHSLVPMAARHIGIDFDELVLRILLTAAVRQDAVA